MFFPSLVVFSFYWINKKDKVMVIKPSPRRKLSAVCWIVTLLKEI
jgi:hypothetical protein